MPLRFLTALPTPPPMMDHGAQPLLPLAGLTILAVEDSRFASEALRLLCQRSGARLRRAETMQAARSHLCVYRPDVMIVDLGLPDGRGERLIRDLARQGPRIPLLLGTSGDPTGRAAALAAGAAGFLDKPLESLAAFQRAILRLLPDRAYLLDSGAADGPPLAPDPLALHDDLARAADLARGMAGGAGNGGDYLAGFVSGLARSSHDAALEQAACAALAEPGGMNRLARLLSTRVAAADGAFTRPGG